MTQDRHEHAAAKPLLTQRDFRERLGNISERKFHQLRAAGVIGDPLELGPRVARWTEADFAATVERLPRRPMASEPQTLSASRRERIGTMKAGAGRGAA